eukprot:1159483-Pelagomonas_calceolata.AAC.21
MPKDCVVARVHAGRMHNVSATVLALFPYYALSAASLLVVSRIGRHRRAASSSSPVNVQLQVKDLPHITKWVFSEITRAYDTELDLLHGEYGPWFYESTFKGLQSKGRFSSLLGQLPIHGRWADGCWHAK